MRLREKIVDYSENEEEVERWLKVKGEEKYDQFADMIYGVHVPLTWKNISDLYRYDKRILVNSFKYISFFEEYARAIIIRHSEDPAVCYEDIHCRGIFGKLKEQLLKLDPSVLEQYFDSALLIQGLSDVTKLRNAVAHNKIILKEDCKNIFPIFCSILPPDYREKFKKDINDCGNKLCIPDEFVVKF